MSSYNRYPYGSVPVHNYGGNVRPSSGYRRDSVNRSEEPSRKETYVPADQIKSKSYVFRQVNKFARQDELSVSNPHVQKATGREYRNPDATSSSTYNQQETGRDVGSGHTQSSYDTRNSPDRNYRQEVSGNDSSKEASPASNTHSDLRQRGIRSVWAGSVSRQRLSGADDSVTKEHNTSSASIISASDKPNEMYTNHEDHMVRRQEEKERFDKTVTEEMNTSFVKTQKLLTTLKELEPLCEEACKEIDLNLQQMNKNALDKANRKVEELEREIQTLHEKIRKIDNDLNVTSAAKETAIYQLDKTVKEKVQVEALLRELQEDTDKFAKQNEILKADLERREKQLKTMHEEFKKKETELSDCKSRLSKLMGDRLGDNNPDIADLSDKNRPTKLAEKFQQLYDDEWTDAFEDSEKIFGEERKAIEVLKSTLESIKTHCDTLSNEQTKAFAESVTMKPTDKIALSKDVLKQIKDLKKVNAELSFDGVFEQYMQSVQKIRGAGDDVTRLVQEENVKPFIKKCVQLCWLMCVQDPPLEFGPDPDPYKPVDTNVYKFYTKTGSNVDYAVWPPLLLNKGGALLCKGVVQGSNKWGAPDGDPGRSSRAQVDYGHDQGVSARDRRRRNLPLTQSFATNPESSSSLSVQASASYSSACAGQDQTPNKNEQDRAAETQKNNYDSNVPEVNAPTKWEWDSFVAYGQRWGWDSLSLKRIMGDGYQSCRDFLRRNYNI